jgi:hypothetical protein
MNPKAYEHLYVELREYVASEKARLGLSGPISAEVALQARAKCKGWPGLQDTPEESQRLIKFAITELLEQIAIELHS